MIFGYVDQGCSMRHSKDVQYKESKNTVGLAMRKKKCTVSFIDGHASPGFG
jgi:prepilin-type processing-associated H-X9-DG protein